ncbi:DUF4230 domain-containing protein [Sphingomonas sp. AOB5]|uniref:DUF4230 domain-containing protein n=1 Tax=Sphingomonas sp. AOB5 TaxID=3034017 RepID=UPI0023F65AF8|nr:DUF4230 domain-containing protein [Sphingomonas sp. AOB5]MDF7775208.1 DUF4230 domain-containing protein [Sphingomonas sp. AOB5]
MEDGGVTERERRRGSGLGGCVNAVILAILILGAIAAGFWFLGDSLKKRFLEPDPVTVATSSLQGLREQNRLSTFAARYVAVVTSKQSRLGLTAQKTLIMPGSVRYEVDLSKLSDKDLSWDAGSNTLTITLPPVEVIGPDVDIDQIREYGEGGILMALTDAEAKLDAANRQAARVELVRQAREATPMRMAREATRRAVENNFALPLRAAGITANVTVRFADEGDRSNRERWDMSRRPEDVYANRQ